MTEVGKPLVKSTIPVEKAEEGLITVKVAATGLVPADWKLRDTGPLGIADNLPVVLGCQTAGRVVSGSATLPAGSRIAFMPPFRPKFTGGLQEYALARPEYLFPVPDHVSDEQAATLAANPATAAIALFHPVFGFGIPLPGSPEASGFDYASAKVVVTGGTAIAKYFVQQARLAGVGTIVAVASPSSNAELSAYGATHVVDRHLSQDAVAGEVRAAAGEDLRFVFETYVSGDQAVAGSFFRRPGGILVVADPNGPFDLPGLTARGIVLKGFASWAELHPVFYKAWSPVFSGWLADGKIKIPPFRTVPFEADAVNEALEDVRKASSGVKYVVKIGS